jgi:hypothetical protein
MHEVNLASPNQTEPDRHSALMECLNPLQCRYPSAEF